MKLVALMPVRNEAYVLGLSARVALRWCDAIVIGLHACTDESERIVQDLQEEYNRGGDLRVFGFPMPEEKWDEMEQRQKLLKAARLMGATHIAIVDADEVLSGNLLQINMFGQGALMDRHCGIPPGHILQLPGYNLRNGIHQYHANGLWGNRWFDVAFADDPALHWSGDRFHHRAPMGRHLNPYRPIAHGYGGVLHLWGADERRLRAKHALYKVTERLRWPHQHPFLVDRMYSWAIKGGVPHETADKWTFADIPATWWAPYADLMQYLHVDAEPWQEAEVRRLVAEHGRERFAGLDLFGVA